MSSSQESSQYKRRSSGKRRRPSRAPSETAAVADSTERASAKATDSRVVTFTPTPQATRADAKARAAASSKTPDSLWQRIVNFERFDGLRRYIRDAMSEIKKVIWPDRETARNLTLLVIAVSLVLGILLGGIDYVLFQLFEAMP